ncbi:hypothetical protein KIH74_30390 [Kineosporia sp. J2-2]|uniref:SHOCT domain-containing protein n=1 Tax=Kineosporia corallincola TaxID=2835133 RepID=A0ABS5TR84_9ACTN|nr:hypothetical protein [Kineosporia corallincola]MBT0773293.1 hypothetical protein [Kineosporia corallincola]
MDGGFFRWLGRAPVTERLRAVHLREDLVEASGRAAFGRDCDAELAVAAALLTDDEVVEQVIEGRRGRVSGLLVLTDRRLLLVAERAAPGSELAVGRDRVLGASAQVRRGLGALTLTTSSGQIVVDQILGTQADTFAANVMRPPATGPAPADPLAELARLRKLHRAGRIGDDEFDSRKRRLVEEI